MGRRGMARLERMMVGSVTARVIGHSPVDVLVVPLDTAIGWKTVLVATDGSRHSVAAAAKAVDFAASYGGRVVAVSVVDLPDEVYGVAPGAVDILIEKARGYAEAVAALAKQAGVTCTVAVREGASAPTIVQLAKEEGAGVIVMASHGRTGLSRLLMGSVTEKVIGHAPCPVLVVR
jgi:nucleotide-binding universal stress UspA family protein